MRVVSFLRDVNTALPRWPKSHATRPNSPSAGTIHVLTDVHGDDQKLSHVINRASGALRPFTLSTSTLADGFAG